MILLALALGAAPDLADTFIGDLRVCGIDDKRAMVEYRDDPQNLEWGVDGAGAVTDQQMACLAKAAAKHGYYVEFANPDLNRRYMIAYEPFQRAAAEAMARDWLKAHGRLDGLPRYDSNRESLASFAARLEAFCGAAPHTVLQASGSKRLTFNAETFRPRFDGDDHAQCTIYAVEATNLEEQGVSFGFLGNEVADPAPR